MGATRIRIGFARKAHGEGIDEVRLQTKQAQPGVFPGSASGGLRAGQIHFALPGGTYSFAHVLAYAFRPCCREDHTLPGGTYSFAHVLAYAFRPRCREDHTLPG